MILRIKVNFLKKSKQHSVIKVISKSKTVDFVIFNFFLFFFYLFQNLKLEFNMRLYVIITYWSQIYIKWSQSQSHDPMSHEISQKDLEKNNITTYYMPSLPIQKIHLHSNTAFPTSTLQSPSSTMATFLVTCSYGSSTTIWIFCLL